jgi:hypothetical protein
MWFLHLLSENGGTLFLWNVGMHLSNCMALIPRRCNLNFHCLKNLQSHSIAYFVGCGQSYDPLPTATDMQSITPDWKKVWKSYISLTVKSIDLTGDRRILFYNWPSIHILKCRWSVTISNLDDNARHKHEFNDDMMEEQTYSKHAFT